MFVDFKHTQKIKVSDYFDPMENSVVQFSVPNYHSVELGFTKHVLLE